MILLMYNSCDSPYWNAALVKRLKIAIDGPVASGKTAVGMLVACKLGYRFLDTGLMYRAITWLALKEHVPIEDASLTRLAQKARISISTSADGSTRIAVNGEDVTEHLRTPEVEAFVSPVSRVKGLRDVMVQKQREVARDGAIVMVGRDIGTVVLSDADLKVFLKASVHVRARRRYEELLAKGTEASYDAVLDNLQERDRIDSQREHAPLRPAQDAHILDTDDIGVEEVVQRVIALLDGGQP